MQPNTYTIRSRPCIRLPRRWHKKRPEQPFTPNEPEPAAAVLKEEVNLLLACGLNNKYIQLNVNLLCNGLKLKYKRLCHSAHEYLVFFFLSCPSSSKTLICPVLWRWGKVISCFRFNSEHRFCMREMCGTFLRFLCSFNRVPPSGSYRWTIELYNTSILRSKTWDGLCRVQATLALWMIPIVLLKQRIGFVRAQSNWIILIHRLFSRRTVELIACSIIAGIRMWRRDIRIEWRASKHKRISKSSHCTHWVLFPNRKRDEKEETKPHSIY